MTAINLKPGDPLVLTLAADARMVPTDYPNDHIWELSLGGGEPPSLSIQTTFGLRARSLRIFPRFILQDTVHSDPSTFTAPISVKSMAVNCVRLACVPHPGINVEIEYWVPTSQSLAGRTTLTNTQEKVIAINLEWVALLNPEPAGLRMALQETGIHRILAGKTANLVPIFYLSGIVQPGEGPYPALTTSFVLGPHETRTATWVEAAMSTPDESFSLARQIAGRNWDAETARIDRINTNLLEIHTGIPEWDTTFTLAQKTARGLLMSNPVNPSHPSTVSTRLPDQGYSMRGDGSDYTHLWDGQSLYDLYYLFGLLLPGEATLVRGFLENFLAAQDQDGDIPYKTSLAGQPGQLSAPPLLSNLVWRFYQLTEDHEFLVYAFPRLLAFVQSWFSPDHDRDGDGLPEWDHPLQTGLDDHPVFAHWHAWSQGLDISIAEGPDLCAYLYAEIEALIQIATLVDRLETIPALQTLSDHLHAAIEASWNESSYTYQYWDRESHHTSSLEILGERDGPGSILLNATFTHPTRLLVRLQSQDETTRPAQGFIHGTGPSGGHRVERFSAERFRWQLGVGRCTSERIYTSLEHVEIQGIKDTDHVILQTPCLNCRELSLLLPLWAGIPSAERARSLIKNTITNPRLFWGAYGLRACAEKPETSSATGAYQRVHPFWNSLVGEGLLRYAQSRRAAELVTRLMKAITHNLKLGQAFYRSFDVASGHAEGERNALLGLAPLGLFLQTVGIQIITPYKVKLIGSNPFPWPVTVKYKNLTVIQHNKKAMIIFPDGQSVTVRNDQPQVISLT
jgi:hypothetical protein